jgi:hypothetical protein
VKALAQGLKMAVQMLHSYNAFFDTKPLIDTLNRIIEEADKGTDEALLVITRLVLVLSSFIQSVFAMFNKLL